MLRTFLALDLEERFLDEVTSLADGLRGRPRLGRARWVGRDVMHVTVRFFGDTDEALVTPLRDAVRALPTGPFEVRARALGAFPDPRHARVLVLALEEPSGVLEAIAGAAEAAAVALGFSPDKRRFEAHLTLARLREPADVRKLVSETKVDLHGRVTALTLYASELGKGSAGGPLYTPLERVPL